VPEATETVFVTGAVARPGAVRILDGRALSITEAVAQAGGTLANSALSKASLKRASGEIVPLDLNRLLVLGQGIGDPQINLQLQPDDAILIPVAQMRVLVAGAVNKAGFIDIADGRTLRVDEALAQAGNPTEQAALTRATVIRGDKTIPLNLYPLVVLGRHDENNIELKDGDRLTVPLQDGVAILGSVAKPGVLYLEEGAKPRLRDALARAGSLSPNIKAGEVRISVLRDEGEKQSVFSVDPVALLEANDPAQNILIKDGDSINVSEIARPSVAIQGEINKPGSYELREGEGIDKLFALAGGQTAYAALRKVEVRRGEEKFVVDVLADVKGGTDNKTPNFKLRSGDRVIVPRNTALVAVWPAVEKPGRYPIPEDGQMTVGDALSAAGGALNAKLQEVAILREGPDGKTQQINLQINKAKGGRTATSEVLQPGDILLVPQEKLRDNTMGFLGVTLSALRLLIP
jgi:protein involved in polysaccharide export with SLBB domain